MSKTVLARAEVDSTYRPARRLFARSRHGHYLPNPALLLRQGECWVPVYDALALAWVETGCGSEDPYRRTPAAAVARLGAQRADAGRGKEGAEAGD